MTDAPAKIVLTRDIDEATDSRRQHARNVVRGTEMRLASGAYIDAAAWKELDARERYILTIRAVTETRPRRGVLSHWSAAAIHGLPAIEPWPETVHFSMVPTSGGRSFGRIVRHAASLSDDDVVEVDGLLVTSAPRTALDLAIAAPRLSSIAVLDRVLHVDRRAITPPIATHDDLWDCYARRLPFRERARARAAIEFATTQSDSPLESVSRVNMQVIGCPRPVLQQRFDDYRGLIGFSEFYWEAHALVGEADGRSKYTDPRYRNGRTLEQVLLDEKDRADRIRAVGPDVSRWGWRTAMCPDALRRHLSAAGLRW